MLYGNTEPVFINNCFYQSNFFNPSNIDSQNAQVIEINSNTCNPYFFHNLISGGKEGFKGIGAPLIDLNRFVKNLNLDPKFKNPEINDFNISSDSPLINAGISNTTGLTLPLKDFSGKERIIQDTIDIGIYEYHSIASRKQLIELNSGWNIISMNVLPENKDMTDVFQSLIDNSYLKKVMNEEGKTLEDWGVYGGWTNGIGDLTSTEGYKVNVKTPTNLWVEGSTFIFPFYIQLSTGWNIISWPSPNSQDGMEAFNTLITEGKLKKVMDESGGTIEDWGVYGGWTNNIGTLKPGEGYKVNVTGDCTLIINESGTKAELLIPETFVSTHFIPAFKGNGTDHMNIYLVNLAESGIKTGDEIGVFDGNICVGSALIPNLLPKAIGTSFVNQNSISIPVSASDGNEVKNGFSDGNSVTLKLFRNGNEYPMLLQPINQSKTVFEKGESLFAMVELATGVEGFSGSGLSEINVYPNPFSDEVTIEIKLLKDSEVQVEVLNQLGQRVKMITTKQQFTNGVHRLTWNGRNTGNEEISSGIYHLKVKLGELTIFRKIVYSK